MVTLHDKHHCVNNTSIQNSHNLLIIQYGEGYCEIDKYKLNDILVMSICLLLILVIDFDK